MLIFTIDDEKYALDELNFAVNEAIPNAEIMSFSRSSNALKALNDDKIRPDVVFSDIRMPGMDGLELALRIKTISPDTIIIFVTGYSEYALKAFKVRADGYLLKPLLPGQILSEIEHFKTRLPDNKSRLFIQCFGNFEVFWNNKPLSFKRKKTKEMLAYLVDLNGASCTSEEMIAILWEDENNLSNAKHNLRNLMNDLKSVLKEINQENIIIRGSRTMAINRQNVTCDYYQMLDGDINVVNSFRGEYMKQYSWAEITLANLQFNQ